MLSLARISTTVTSLRDGAVVSIVKELTDRLSLAMPLLVTLRVQLLYVASARASKVIVLLPEEAELVELLQLPP